MTMMMSKGRGSGAQKTTIKNKVGILVVLVLVILVCMEYPVDAEATYTVGDDLGWSIGVFIWPLGKTFQAGDVLVFNYNPLIHNVVKVGKAGYVTCLASPCAKVYRTGNDSIKLEKGINYFICTTPGLCLYSRMKIAVLAE
ncbi:hypothetical protein FNV43_RR10757 [Rhamnella rubrinervis]|uniref:Basic blue protein n=1 Tax=Rhamnella rubrinervis TaxID=2594499 RepID=A0A8K0MH04_9ROSA|nr:hypothetical protein FNV43_RR10757 [Rhamnella rubrinervis]